MGNAENNGREGYGWEMKRRRLNFVDFSSNFQLPPNFKQIIASAPHI